MILVDTALAKRLQTSGPIRVALVGGGYMEAQGKCPWMLWRKNGC